MVVLQNFGPYEEWLDRIVAAIEPLLDTPPVDVDVWTQGSLRQKLSDWPAFKQLLRTGTQLSLSIRVSRSSCIHASCWNYRIDTLERTNAALVSCSPVLCSTAYHDK